MWEKWVERHNEKGSNMKDMLTVRLAAAASCVCVAAFANENAAPERVTYSKHIAPILFDNCVGCHRPGDIAPMSLLSYEEARPFAKAIQENAVQKRAMPPWHSADPHGTFSNDRRLTDDQIALIDRWVRTGASQGDPADMPKAPEFTPGWRLGEPDFVLKFQPVEVTADGPDQFENLVNVANFGEDKWITAIEIKPSDRRVVHHVIAITQDAFEATKDNQTGIQGWLAGWAAGTDPLVLPKGTARFVKNGTPIIANMHYHPMGQAATDTTEIGFHFAKAGVHPREIINHWISNGTFEIPAGAANHEVSQSWKIDEDITIMTIAPHMHFRGNDMTITATLPDGAKKVLVTSPDYDFNWQTQYQFAKPVDLPKGSVVDVVGHFDNSPNNPANPDPTKNVRFGPQSFDEMFIGILDYVKKDESTASGD